MSHATALPASIAQDVGEFCIAHQLLSEVDLVIRLAEKALSTVKPWEVSLQEDPEVEIETYMIVDVAVAALAGGAQLQAAIAASRRVNGYV